jgi:uncharacterized membrane protein YkvA (DUF1232 family)
MRSLAIALGAVFGAWLIVLGVLVLVGRRSAARELSGLLPNLVRLFKGLIRDPRVPRRCKVMLAFAALWVLSPIDLVPEFLPVIGPLDDAIMAAVVLRYVSRRTDPDIMAEHWRGAPGTLELLLRAAGARRN